MSVKVWFIHGRRDLGRRDMPAVPRAGEGVTFDGTSDMVVWNVAWHLDGTEPVAFVALKTDREYRRALG